MSDAPLWQWSACDLAAAIRDGRIASADAVASVVERIAATNGTINAVVDDLSENALEEAAARDRSRSQGASLGPLHGVPVTVKENVDQEGRATPNGVPAFADIIAPADSPVVANLRKAGAVIVGRTNTPEFSFRATTDNPLHGATLNPWDHARSPGGSSGGAAAATLMGYGPIAHGNDIGGSLRFPSAACGLATVRPTLGRVPAYNPSAAEERGLLAQLMSVQGTIAREVRDVRLGTRVMAEGDPRDPWWVPAPFDGPALEAPIRVAVTRRGLGYDIHPAILDAVSTAADHLADAGYDVVEADPPGMDGIAEFFMRNLFGEMEILLREIIRAHGSEVMNRIIDDYGALFGINDAEQLVRGMAERTRIARAWNLFFDEHPLLLSPFLMRPIYGLREDAEGREQVHDIFLSGQYSFVMNLLGLPAAIIPALLHEGLPVGVQIAGRRYREDLCLDAAEAVERRVGVMAQRFWQREGWA